MLTFFIVVGSIALVILCAWLLLLILMQKPSANAGMGAALGGGAAESAFGGEASNVLTRWTVYGIIGFFALTLSLTLMQIYRHHHREVPQELAPIAEEELVPGSLTKLPDSVTQKAKTTATTQKEAKKDSKKVSDGVKETANLSSSESSKKATGAKTDANTSSKAGREKIAVEASKENKK